MPSPHNANSMFLNYLSTGGIKTEVPTCPTVGLPVAESDSTVRDSTANPCAESDLDSCYPNLKLVIPNEARCLRTDAFDRGEGSRANCQRSEVAAYLVPARDTTGFNSFWQEQTFAVSSLRPRNQPCPQRQSPAVIPSPTPNPPTHKYFQGARNPEQIPNAQAKLIFFSAHGYPPK
jgi:hypothetical protein